MAKVSAVSAVLGTHRVPLLVIQTPDRNIVSAPSQLGCAARCSFCISATQAPVRSLAGSEIWWMANLAAEQVLPPRVPFELAITGEGEPTLNPVAIQRALWLAWASGRVTSARVSTMGAKVRNLPLLSHPHLPVELQLSVHATLDAARKKLMPAASPWAELELEATEKSHLFSAIRMNYVLMAGINDTDADACRLAQMGSLGWRITLSPTLGPVPQSSRITQFISILQAAGREVSVFSRVGELINGGLYEKLTYRPRTDL